MAFSLTAVPAELLSADDLILRTSNTEDQKINANSFATLDELEAFIRFRMDRDIWFTQEEDMKVRAAVQAYRDINRLTWRTDRGLNQARDYEFNMDFGLINEPPFDDTRFPPRVKEAQAAQAMYYLRGTQVRDMARDGISMTRALSGSELEFKGYRGAVCTEAKEILAWWIELYPRTKRVGRF